jgi:molecular chaperone Hsp33
LIFNCYPDDTLAPMLSAGTDFSERRPPVQDYLVRIITRTASMRGLACVTTRLVHEACRRHGAYPTACAALGRALTGGALMGARLKTGQRVALMFRGNGPLQKIIVEAESNGAVRGYVGVPEVHRPLKKGKLDVAGALGRAGFLTVSKDLGQKAPCTATVPLCTSEIAEDLAHYLTASEQIASAVGLGVRVAPDGRVSAAGGFLLQTLSPADDAVIDTLTERIANMPPLTELLRQGQSPEALLAMLFTGIPFDTLEKRALAFQCACSRERMERALIGLGRKALAGMVAGPEEAEVTCQFCRRRYPFRRQALARLMEAIPSSDSQGP